MSTTLASVQIPQLDLEVVKSSVAKKNPTWDLDRLNDAVQEYLRFLAMCKHSPSANITPPHDVDEMWHTHILNTVKYAEDCEGYFDCFLHHHPWMGEFYDHNAQSETVELYEKLFGEPAPKQWSQQLTCNSCNGNLQLGAH